MGRKLTKIVDAEIKFDSKLINKIKNYPNVFDRNHKLFEDSETRLNTWKIIAENLGQTSEECEERWIYIVNRFYDELQWILEYAGTSSPWLLFPQLDFLIDFVELRDLCI